VTAATFAFFMYVGVLIPLVPQYVEDELHGGELGIGLAIAVFAIVAIAVRPLIGQLVIRYGRRAVMIGGAALAAAAGSMYGFVDSLPALLVLRGLTGAGEAALFVAAMTLIADLSPSDRRAEAASYFSVAVYAGIGLGPIVGEAMLTTSGFRSAFALAGLFAVVSAVVSLTVPHHVTFAGAVPVDDAKPTTVARWLHPDAVGPGVVLAIGMAAFAVFAAFLPDHARSLGLSGSGGLFAVYSAACLVLRVGGARLPERLGPRVSVTTAFTMLGIGLALFAAITEQWALWLAAACVGVGMAFMYPSLMAFTVNRAPEAERPRAIASFTMFFEAGTAVGGLALGALADALGKRAGFAAAAGLCVVGAWVLRTVVIPASIDDHRPPMPAVAPLAAASTDLH
jgi:MFS family permease